MNKLIFIHAVLCFSTNCLSQAKTSNENLSPEFTGQKYFESSGLYYFNNRYYDPVLGRFLTPDPLQQYVSPYSYADGDPLGRVDPSGLIFEGLAELASSAFRTLTSCCRGGVTERLEVRRTEESIGRRVQPDNDMSRTTQGAVGGRAEATPNISRSLSDIASLISSSSFGVEEGSIQSAFDPYHIPGLEDHLQAIDEHFSHRTAVSRRKTIGPVQRENMVIWTIGIHRKSKFINRFSRDLMEFMLNDMDESDGSGYDLTDIIRDQYRLAAREGGFLNYLPRKLRIVYPTPTLAAIDQISIQKVMNDFGLRMTEFNSYERGGNVTEVFVEPVKPISVDQLQKVNRDLSDDLFL